MSTNNRNTANIGGNYTGTVTVSGPAIFGENIISEGRNTPIVITGGNTSASSLAAYSLVGGQFARAESSLSFVWNGSKFEDGDVNKPQYGDSNPYLGANRPGTFSINPHENLKGMFIGNKSLKTHMDELSGHVVKSFSLTSSEHSSGLDNNIVHKDGNESISGSKTFESSVVLGDSDENRVLIENSSIHIYSDGNGGMLFHFNGSSSPTASLKETESGTILFGSKISVGGNSAFNSESNTFNGIMLSSGKTASFENGNVYVATQNSHNNSSLVASTEYVDNAISNLQSDTVLGNDGTYTGRNVFANTISLAYNVEANFVSGKLYVADQNFTSSSSIAANTKFVKNIASSLSKSLLGDSTSIGSNIVPVYVNNSSLVQSNGSVGGSLNPIYMIGGSLVGSSGTVGGVNRPVYLSGGVITECNGVVNTSYNQKIDGRKVFSSSLNMFKSSLHVYEIGSKGDTSSYGKKSFVDFILADDTTTYYNYDIQRNKIGEVGTKIDNQNLYTDTYLQVVQNAVASPGTIVFSPKTMGISINTNGREYFAFGPTPTKDAVILSDNTTTSSIIPTIGWANTYYARKDGTTFSGTVAFSGVANFNSTTKIINSIPAIEFKIKNTNYGYTSKIAQPSIGKIKITPCNSDEENTVKDTASSILLGSQSIGSGTNPVYINKGALTKSNSSVGNDYSPIFLSSGIFKKSSATTNSLKPLYMSSGSLSEMVSTVGDSVKPVYLNNGKITEISGTVGGEFQHVYLRSGKITKCSSSLGSELKPIYINSSGMFSSCKEMVCTAGDQTIRGAMTFSGTAYFQKRVDIDESSQIIRYDIKSGAHWVDGRDYAMVRVGTKEGLQSALYNPAMSIKTIDGSWDISTYLNNTLHIGFVKDSDYENYLNGVTNSNRTNGLITFEYGIDRTVTSMPLGFLTLKGPLTGKTSLHINSIPYIGGTPRYILWKVINCCSNTYQAKVGGKDFRLGAYESSGYITNYNISSPVGINLPNASLSLNIMLY